MALPRHRYRKAPAINPANLDLNLLVSLDALLAERSVTRAAERLGLTQPTLSAALARLRRHFDDELLYRDGNNYFLTPLAVTLSGRTSSTLDSVQRLFASQNVTDPGASTRTFVITCSDYTAAVVGAPLGAALARIAPNASLQLRQSRGPGYTSDEGRLRSVDAAIVPHGFLHAFPHVDLYSDRWRCLVATDNDSVGAALTLDDLSRLPWVVTSRESTFSTTAMAQLARAGVAITVQTEVDTFLAMPHMIAGTERIALAQGRLIELIGNVPGVRVLDCPFDLDPLAEALWWHPDYARDAEHAWFRDLVASVAAPGGA